MKKLTIGTAAAYDFGGSVLWLEAATGQIFPLLLWKEGPVTALVAREDEPVPEDRYYVRLVCMCGPVRAVKPDGTMEETEIGEDGDLVVVYRAGQKQVRFIIWPGRYRDYVGQKLSEMYPADFDPPVYEGEIQPEPEDAYHD